MGTPEFVLMLLPVIYIVGLVVLIFITRLIFSIPAFLRYQKAQTQLLSEIAMEKGVATSRVNEILSGIKKQK